MPYLNISANHNLYYETIDGDKLKPHLVFLHEGLGCTSSWANFPELLCTATGCPGLLYDRLGYGFSSPTSPTRSDEYLCDYAEHELPTVLTKIIPDSEYILVGHSDGGTIALLHGAMRPPRLTGIITEAAHVFVDSQTIAGLKAAKVAWEQGKFRKLYKYHGEKTDEVFNSWVDTWLDPTFRDWNIVHLLPAIEAPLLVLQGKNDQYGMEEQVHAIGNHSSGHSKIGIIDNCGHIPHLEEQQATLQLMTDFVEKICNKAKG